jgi:hypothetical protein
MTCIDEHISSNVKEKYRNTVNILLPKAFREFTNSSLDKFHSYFYAINCAFSFKIKNVI